MSEGWPTVPGLEGTARSDVEKALYQAKLDSTEADKAAERSIDEEFFKAMFAVAQGSIDRVRGSADTVQKSAAAIATIYTTALAVSFSVKDNPLPSRGVIPVLFLGLSILASTAYLAYQSHAGPVRILEPKPTSGARNAERANSLVRWTRATAEHRTYLLKVSVVALAAGLAFLPAPFVSFKSTQSSTAAAKPTTGTTGSGGGTAAQPTKATPDWPKPSANAGSDPALQKIVYTAQVAETADLRKQARENHPSNTGSNETWWHVAFVLLLAVLILPLVIDYILVPVAIWLRNKIHPTAASAS